ncbi:carboxypeptidase regulatory-like domain-containing protein [Jatrophihabitans sp. YIM 134969]
MVAATFAAVVATAVAPGFTSTAAAAPTDRSTHTVPLCASEVAPGHARCFAVAQVTDGQSKGTTPKGLTPANLRSAYQLPANGGAGVTVAIVDAYDNPKAEADLAVYRKTMGLPALQPGQFRKVDQRGGTDIPAPDAGWAGEIALDLDAVSAVAPLADLLLVETDSSLVDDLGKGVATAVALGADVVSNSYGSRYASSPTGGENPDQLEQDAAYYDHPGVAVVASTGDDGFGVAYPAASPHVTAVGGTSLARASGTNRGWRETVWDGAGSGCSVQQPQPTWQTGTSCDHRASADVAAVADPATGLASYNSYSGHGWIQVGGTSLAAPVVAGVYALAGRAEPGTEPVTYPWAHRGALFDVTGGSNGSCDPAVWCTAGPGWDGPTGLGTPRGTSAFVTGPHGTLAGEVTTTAAGHAPIAGAAVTATRVDGTADATDRATAVTDADGHYDLTLSAGSWTVSASAYGSYDGTSATVTVTAGATTPADVTLKPRAVRTVSGRVTDASGHGWALPATVTVDDVPGGPVTAAPATGRYTLALPAGRSYTLHVTAGLPGYLPVTRTVKVGAADVALDVPLTVDAAGVAAPGYETRFDGRNQGFGAGAVPTGWTVADTGDTPGWRFDDPRTRGNETGGSGGFAIVDSDAAGSGHHQDSLLTGPVTDLHAADHPTLQFSTYVNPYDGQDTTVELSVDGGSTWSTVWNPAGTSSTVSGVVSVPLPTAVHQRAVQVRFHYTGTWATWWEVDDVALGDREQAVVPGGLVLGTAKDATTGAKLPAVDVSGPGDLHTATGAGGAIGDGRFEVFVPAGTADWTASRPGYRPVTVPVTVVADRVTTVALPLSSGRSVPAQRGVAATVAAGGTGTVDVTVRNTGTAPVVVRPHEQASGYGVPSPGAGAPAVDVPATVSRSAAPVSAAGAAGAAATAPTPAGRGGWRALADAPAAVFDNATASNGTALWSVGGVTPKGYSAALYRLDLRTGTWSRKADASVARAQASAVFIGGKLYVTGGWVDGGGTSSVTEVYDPATDRWTSRAPVPLPYAAMGEGAVDGKLYLVGGCSRDWCGSYDLQVYDPASDAWTWAPGTDKATSFAACGGIGHALYCAGGTDDNDTQIRTTQRFDPATSTWTRLADLPTDQWGGTAAVGDGRLVVSGGVVENRALTNRTWAYDPAIDAWSSLPAAPVASYRGGGASGLFAVGGSTGTATPLRSTWVLPGWGTGSATDAPWLSVADAPVRIAPGATATIRVRLTAVAVTPSGGSYQAAVVLEDDSPYPPPVVRVTMRVP